MSDHITKADVRNAYGIGVKTFRSWVNRMRRADDNNKQLFDEWFDRAKIMTPAQVKAFIQHHGEPGDISKDSPVYPYI